MGKKTEDSQSVTSSVNARGNWSSGLEFLLSCISISIGLGNVWRFPTLAYENGGGAFLIPYFIVIFLVSKPLYYMELAFGQFAGKSPARVWSCVPGFKGIGIAQMLSTFFLTVYYNYIMAISLFYLFASMQSTLPWSWCDPEWADSDTCFQRGAKTYSPTNNSTFNLTNDYDNLFSSSAMPPMNVTLVPPPAQYFEKFVLKDSGSLEGLSSIDYRMALCLLLSWSLVAISIVRGVQSLGKVVYVTASYPYIVLIAMLILALTMKGSITGIKYFFEPKWEMLLDVTVWYKACEQSFFSLNTGFGHLIMYASYNNFKHNIHRDALIISVADTLTSVLAGCVVFAILGSLAAELNIDVDKVVVNAKDLNLAFVAYPEALARIQFVPQLWSVLFFIMLFMLGLGSAVGHIEAITTTIKDEMPSLHKRKSVLAIGCCVFCFLCGLPLTTNSGQYIMSLLNNYGVGAAVFLYGILELVGLMWIYGWRRFCDDVHFMLGTPVALVWKVTWALVAPIALIVIYVYGTINLIINGMEPTKGVPEWGTAIAWVFAAICIIQIPLWFIYIVYKSPEITLKKKFLSAFKPTSEWGPSNSNDREEWLQWKDDQISPKRIEINLKSYDNIGFH